MVSRSVYVADDWKSLGGRQVVVGLIKGEVQVGVRARWHFTLRFEVGKKPSHRPGQIKWGWPGGKVDATLPVAALQSAYHWNGEQVGSAWEESGRGGGRGT